MTNSNSSGNPEVRLVGLAGPYRGNSYVFRENELLIGRVPGSDLLMVENTISAQHAKIVKVGDRYEIQDLRSTNGTFVNGVKVDRKFLRSGDKIKFDQIEFEFVNPADVSRTMMATSEAMAGLGQTIARAPQPPPAVPYAAPPSPAYTPTAFTARSTTRAAKGSLAGGAILGMLVGLIFAYLVYLIVFLVQSRAAAGMSPDIVDVLKGWAVTFPGMHTHAGWSMTGIRTIAGAAILISLFAAPVLGGLVAQAVGKRARAKTAWAFSLAYVLVAVVAQLAAIKFAVDRWPSAFPPLLASLGAWGNLAVCLAYFLGVVFVLSFVGTHFARKNA
jgi:hypothetical protein